jgi:hypothetical protein
MKAPRDKLIAIFDKKIQQICFSFTFCSIFGSSNPGSRSAFTRKAGSGYELKPM